MKRNHYIEALEADRTAERKPWDQSAFSNAMASRERALMMQDRVTRILEKITWGGFALGILLVISGLGFGWWVIVAALCIGFVLTMAYLWMSIRAWLNIRKFEAALLDQADEHEEIRRTVDADV